MNRNYFLFFVSLHLFLFALPANAQSGKVPLFRIIQNNGKIFKAEDLSLGKPIIIIYFSPECNDCQILIDKVLARIGDFKSSSIAMTTYLSLGMCDQFFMQS